MDKPIAIQELIEVIKIILEKDERIKVCYKFQADKAMQIQLHTGDVFVLTIRKLYNKSFVIKRL